MELPLELWCMICSHLDSLDSLHRLMLVSRSFNSLITKVIKQENYWGRLLRLTPLPGKSKLEQYFNPGTYPSEQEGTGWDWAGKKLWHRVSRVGRDDEEESEDEDLGPATINLSSKLKFELSQLDQEIEDEDPEEELDEPEESENNSEEDEEEPEDISQEPEEGPDSSPSDTPIITLPPPVRMYEAREADWDEDSDDLILQFWSSQYTKVTEGETSWLVISGPPLDWIVQHHNSSFDPDIAQESSLMVYLYQNQLHCFIMMQGDEEPATFFGQIVLTNVVSHCTCRCFRYKRQTMFDESYGTEELGAHDFVFYLFLTADGTLFYLDHAFTVNEIMYLGGRPKVRMSKVSPGEVEAKQFDTYEGLISIDIRETTVEITLTQDDETKVLYQHRR